MRVWAYFAINLVATWFAVRALAEMWSDGLIVGRVADSDEVSDRSREATRDLSI